MRNSLKLFLLLSIFTMSVVRAQTPAYMQWWQNDKFGLFLHWGIYAIGHSNGKPQKSNEHFMWGEKIPLATYKKLADSLTLEKYDADAWVKMAKEAGMKYLVITAKHHDGFAMYDSPSNDFNIVKLSPQHKDPMTSLAAACKKYGLKLCFYYSLGRDWENPDAYWAKEGSKASNDWDYPDGSKKDNARYIENKVKPQLKELLTQYGPVGVIWFDTPEGTTPAQSEDLRRFIHGFQPNCIINSRIGNGFGDFGVAEQKIEVGKVTKPWESCITMSRKWGYSIFDQEWKSPEVLVRHLVEIVCKGGNLLLNVGPTAKGEFTPAAIERLKAIGNWMKINQEAIYGVQRWTTISQGATEIEDTREVMGKAEADNTSKKTPPDIYFSKKGKVVYIYARSWKKNTLNIESMAKGKMNIDKITLLGSKASIKWKQNTDALVLTMPVQLPDVAPVYVFKVEQ